MQVGLPFTFGNPLDNPFGIPFGISFEDVLAARERLADAVVRTPAAIAHTLSSITGAEVVLKFENLQFTGSFEERGALNRLLTLTPDERSRGVVAMSAGNHARGLAHHAARLGVSATLVMPEGTPMVEIGRTRALGADRPGSLHALTGVLAAQGANVVELSHDRMGPNTRLRSAVVDVQFETADREHRDAVVAALCAEGFAVTAVD
jgi:cysteine synthase